jgi:hypothetical protein
MRRIAGILVVAVALTAALTGCAPPFWEEKVEAKIPGADTMSNPQLAAAMLAAFRTGWLETPFDVSEVGVCVLSTTEPTAEEWEKDNGGIRYKYELTGVNQELSALLPDNWPGLASSCYWTYLGSTLELKYGPRDSRSAATERA